jgi:putative peptide zinc metalloprotease protein
MKLDGYHILSDALGILDLKETSTAYVSAWVKRHVFRLPVEVPYVPKRRRLGFAFYAVASGLYSYTVLYILARFVGNIFRNFNPEWSFIPELGTGALIFRSRLRTLANFMKFFYLDKKDRVRGWLVSHRLRSAPIVTAILIFLFLPLWHESITARFVLRAAERAEIRAQMPGIVTRVNADEGQIVSTDEPIIELRNLPLASRLARTNTDYKLAAAELGVAELHYSNTGPALQKRDQMAAQNEIVVSQAATLQLRSPVTGTVTTPRLRDRLGTYVTSGTELAEVADMRTMRAQIYVSEYEMYRYHSDSKVLLQVEGSFRKWQGRILSTSPASREIADGLIDLSRYNGISPPTFYEVSAIVNNPDGILKPGMTGTARISGPRRSVAGLIYQSAADALRRKLW